MMKVVGFGTFELRSTTSHTTLHTQSKQTTMPPAVCSYCEITLSSSQNYTKHLRYYATAKRQGPHNKHPSLDSDEFDALKKTLKMWEKPAVIEDDPEAQEQAKRGRKSTNNANYYNKKKSENENKVKAEIHKAL
jgi:hypothetical protein